MPSPIYVVKTYKRRPSEGRADVVGYFHTLEGAVEAVEHNYGDIEEAGWYQFALICEVPCGLYGLGDEKKNLWYEFKRVDPFFICKEPDCQRRTPQRCDHNWKWQRIDGPPQKLLDSYGLTNIYFGGIF